MKILLEPVDVIVVERAGREEDQPGLDDLPQCTFRGGVLHARSGPAVRPGCGIKIVQLLTSPS